MSFRAEDVTALTDVAPACNRAVDGHEPDVCTDDRELVSPFGGPRGSVHIVHAGFAGAALAG